MSQRQPIAVVGYAYRAPGVGRKGLWELLEEAKSAWSPIPADRFNQDAYHHPNAEKPGFISSKGAHFLPDDIYAFDPSFFKISAEEARSMDPQHRILLECAFEAAENAGLTLSDLLGSDVGVFAAGVDSDYNISMAEDMPTSSKYMAVGVAPTMFANRLSYFFGLTGPSITVDAACASSSYALHLACQNILAGECSTAFVGGAKLLNGPFQWSGLDTMGTLSPEGKCFSYDSRASGFGKGEGAACVIIKRLSDALACGDAIRAIIRNTACNHSGRTQGISMPSRASQEELLLRLHRDVGVEPNETSFVEGHGTGTPIGDPIDASAISSVVASGRSSSDPVHIGAVKSNLGHLEGASGLISIIKCIMMLERGVMLPNANFTEMNPKIEGRDRLKVLTKSAPWPSGVLKRACVSNFGFGGSNAAILLEEAPRTRSRGESAQHAVNGIPSDEATGTSASLHTKYQQDLATPDSCVDDGMVELLFAFSAQSTNSLEGYLSSFVEYLGEEPESTEFATDLAFTLGQRRTHFAHRVAVAASSTTSLRGQLQSMPKPTKTGKTKDPIVAFTFTGQGAQYFQMSAGLRRYREFATTIIAAERFLSDLGATWSLTEELDKDEHKSRINDAEISQPVCTAVQLALVVLLRSWGVIPTVVLGHSSGEIAAAFAAGLVSFKAAIAIAYFRGIAARDILEDPSVQGAMLAIGTSAGEAQKLLDAAEGYAIVAAVNSPDSVTLSGDVAAVEQSQEQAEKRGLFVRRLKVGVAYHSHHMTRVADSYLAAIQPFCASGQSSPAMDSARTSEPAASSDARSTGPWFISTVTGQRESTDPVHASYWVKNLLQPVQYSKAVEALFSVGDNIEEEARVPNVVVEVGPHSALQGPTKQTLDRITSTSGQESRTQVSYLPSLVRGKSAMTMMLDLAGNLFAMGSELDLAAINQTKDSPVQALTDLPSYVWNKAARYIHQSRFAANKLSLGGPYNRLLGWKSPYSEGNEHTFRNVFTLDDLPWIRDHVVAGQVLFPFTAFISLAVEGFRALDSTLSPGLVIQEFHVTTSLEIEEDQPVDITTRFRPAATGTETVSSTAWTFEILSWSDSHQWTRHSYGLIEADHSHESLRNSPNVQFASQVLGNKALKLRDAQEEYSRLRTNSGLTYGSTFRNMVDLWQAPGATVQTILLRQLESDPHALPEASPVTVDPPTLDTIFHCLGALLGGNARGSTFVPSFCLRWRISNHIAADAGRQFSVVGRLLGRDEKSGTTHIQFVVFEASTSSSPPKPIAEIGPVRLQCIDRPDAHDLRLPDTYAVKHVPYVDLIDPYPLSEMVKGGPSDIAAGLQQRHDLDRAAVYFLSRTLEEIAKDDTTGLPLHHIRFLGWAERAVKTQQSAIRNPAAMVDNSSSSSDPGYLIRAVGAQLPQILRGEQQPLKVMLEDDLLQRFYERHEGGNRLNQVAARYIARLAECNPDLNILEVGGGTASATLHVLESIQSATKGTASCVHYTFTDISAGFFDNARSKLGQWTGQMTYKKLDISQDPLSQGFNAEAYDIVLASNVLHATPDIVATVKNARAVLKPNGKLVLVEAVREAAPHFLPFVLLEDWWLSKDSYRSSSDGPLLSKELWNEVLEANGFSGVEGHVDDYPGQPEQFISVMWSTKRDLREAIPGKKTDLSVVVYHQLAEKEDLEFTKAVAADLARQLGGTSTVKQLLQVDNNTDTSMCVVLDGRQRSMLSDLSSAMFSGIKDLLMHAPSLLWVLPDESHPDASIVKGVLRSLRLEASTSRLVLLEAPFNVRGAGALTRVVQHMMWDPNSAIRDEQEYSLVDGIIHVPRLQLVEAPKETFIAEAGGSVKMEQNIWHGNHAIEMTLDAAGSPDSVYFRHTDILNTELGAQEVVVRVGAVGMNFRDLLLVLGSLSWHAPGLEGAGVVASVGSQVNDLRVGDRVFYMVHEAGMANFVRIPSSRAHRLPERLGTVAAASMPVAYSTAIISVLEVGRLRRGESILVHSASGAVGQACIMVAQQAGARIFATAGSADKREFIAQTFGIPKTQIFSSRTREFKDGILQATHDRGIDVVVNSLSGQLLQQTWDLIAENGRFVEIGKKDLLENKYLPMRHFDRNVTFSAVDLRKAADGRPETVKGWLSSIIRMFESEEITPIRPVTSIPVSQVKTGLRKLQSGQNIGKIVVTLGSDETVMVERPSPLRARSDSLLYSDATYLITGGTGGLGRALASWMIKKGARNLVLLGRSSTPSAKVMELLERYEGTDVCIRATACDVGSRPDLVRTAEALKGLPRVRGVIHGALYLRDAILPNTTFEDWQQVMGPKVKGAWHLHELFPDLDFFVSLSSMTGILGRTGTSLYAGTSTFLDSFSEYRVRLGLPAVTVDLPIVEEIGLAVDRGIMGQLRANLGVTINQDQFYTLIEGAIIGPSSGLNANGRSLSWTLASKTDIDHLAWEHFNPLSVMRRLRSDSGGADPSTSGGKNLQDLLKDGSPELLIDALSDKVSSITMIDRDEITPDRNLLDYGLDSLFSLELRNWIRRSLDVDMALKDITTARDLKALVGRILPLMKSTLPQSKSVASAAAETESTPESSSPPVNGAVSQALPISPLLGVEAEEIEGIQKHLQSTGIDTANVELVLPCAPIQEGILFAQLKSQRSQYFESLTFKITPEGASEFVDVDKIANAWKALCMAQPMLRTVFTSSPSSVGAFQQVILKQTDPSISHATVDSQARLKSILETMEEPHFAAAQPPHHVHLTRASDYLVYASFYINHALVDDRSFQLLGQQLRQAYANPTSVPKGLDISRYISWVRSHSVTAKDYWMAHLAGSRPCFISLLSSFESSLLDRGSLPHIDVSIDQPRPIHAFCRQHGVTVANLVQVAWGLLLRQCTGSRSVTFGCGQSQIGNLEDDEMMLGPLLTNMICRFDVDPGTTLLELLTKARQDSLRALELPSYSMGELQEAIGLGRSSIFDTCLTIVRYPPEASSNADGIRAEYLQPDENPTEYAITAGVGYDNNRIQPRVWYDATRISRSLAAQIGPLFAILVTKIVGDPDQSVESLESSTNKPSVAFTAQDVAKAIFREASSQCEIAPSSLEDICVCSPLQQQQVEASIQQGNGGCMDQYVFGLPEHVSTTKFYDALDAVATASPALRTRFVSLKQGGICQVTVKATPGWNGETSLSDYLQWDRDFRIRYGGPLCRFGEVDQPDGKRYFVLSLHPAIYDPWTLALILNAVSKAYEDDGTPPTPFPSFSTYQRRLSGRNNDQSEQDSGRAQPQWSHEASLQFPRVTHDASQADLSNSRSLDIQLPSKDSGNDCVATTLAVLHAAWALCLSRVSGDRKVCFGVHVDDRSAPVEDIARVTGPVGAVIPCAIDLATLSTGDSLLSTTIGHEHTMKPFQQSANSNEISASHDIGTTTQSFRNVLIVHKDPELGGHTGRPEILELLHTKTSESSFNGARLITRCWIKSPRILCIEMQFDKNVISPEDVEVLLQQYNHAIEQLLVNASAQLTDLVPLSNHERSLLQEWNKDCPRPVHACIQDQIRDVARRQRTAPAICSWDYELDYAQLDDLSDRTAALLQKNGVRAGTMVPYFLEKSAAAAVVMLGILKAGGALVALDVDHPAQRLATILADIGTSTIITSSALSKRVDGKVDVKHRVVIDMESIQNLPLGGPGQLAVQSSDPCYIVYTSGSTGTPKGIVLSHSNFATSVQYTHGPLGITTATRTLQFSNFIWDMAMYEIFMTLASGGCVCMPQEAERLNDIPGVFQRTRANWALLVPSVATLLDPAEVPTLRTLCLGGEPFPRNMMERWKHICLINAYGPGETTVMSSHNVVSAVSGKHRLNIGRPVACRYWVVDSNDHNQLVPIGCPGELLVQGPIVGQGYLGDAEKTRQAFIELPTWTSAFGSLDLSSQRWYKTGDLVVQAGDGSVIFQGRKGTQVKLAGQRIELEEIEYHLGRFSDPGWKIAVELIMPSGQDQDPCLAMFFAVASVDGKPIDPEKPAEILPSLSQQALTLRGALIRTLPVYMVPQYFIRLDRLPSTSSNKTDRKELRRLGATLSPEQLSPYSGLVAGARQEGLPSRDINREKKANQGKDFEAELRKLWARVLALPLDRIKATDSFFDLGGSSVRAMRLINTARRARFALTVTDVFTTPVLSDMAATMRPVSSGTVGNPRKGQSHTPHQAPSSFSSTSISRSLKKTLTQLGFVMDDIERVADATDMQAEMAALTELDAEMFDATFRYDSAAGLEVEKITRACESTIRHHPTLRTVLVQDKDNLRQVVLRSPKPGMVLVTTEEEQDKGQEDLEEVTAAFGDSLPQFCIQVKGGMCHSLILRIRHAFYDATSLPVLLDDLRAAYAQQALPDRPRFHDWVSYVNSQDRAPSRTFWRDLLHGSSMTNLVPPVRLPTSGFPCRNEIYMRIPMVQTSYGTPASLIQAAWALVLARATGQQDIVFAVTNANRNSDFPDTDLLPGPCLNQLPVRISLDHAAVTTLGSLVAHIQDQAVAAIPHQHLGVRDIIKNCTDWPAWTRYNSVVLYQNHDSWQDGATVKFDDVDCVCSGKGRVGQSNDIWIVGAQEDSELEIKFWYTQDTLPEDKAQWAAGLLRTILEAMSAALEEPLHRVAPNWENVPSTLAAAPLTVDQLERQGAGVSNAVNGSGTPSAQSRAVVSQAWDEVGLVVARDHDGRRKEKDVEVSMFSCGADLVATLLLSRCYRRQGYDLSMRDVSDHPTQAAQARLLETRIKGVREVNGGEVNGVHVNG